MYKTAKSPSTKALTIVNKSTLYKNLNKSCNDKLNKYKIVTTSYTEGKSTIKGEIFKELYQYRELLKTNVKKDIRGKYKASFLGVLWSFVNPLLQV